MIAVFRPHFLNFSTNLLDWQYHNIYLLQYKKRPLFHFARPTAPNKTSIELEYSFDAAMILRNLELNESDRRELKTKIFASDHKNLSSSLTLNTISTRHEECEEREYNGERSRSSSACGLNCDFLLGPTNSIGEARIEELTIERCRLDLEGARVLGKALRTNSNNSAISALKSLRMVNLVFWDEDNEASEILLPLLEGLSEAGKRGGCLESLEFRRIEFPSALRSRFFSALGECKNLRSLKLTDCDIRPEDAFEFAEALAGLSLESLDLSQNHIDGGGLEILLKHGKAGKKNLKRLVLSHNPIGDNGAVYLSEFLSQPSIKIESLVLLDCDLWLPGCSSLARGLRNFTLRELVVGGEWEHHLESIADSLRTNVSLKQLLIASQAFCEADQYLSSTIETIEFYLNLNRAHRRISVDENLSFKLWPTILGNNNNNETKVNYRTSVDLWYHLLSRRPELVATDWS